MTVDFQEDLNMLVLTKDWAQSLFQKLSATAELLTSVSLKEQLAKQLNLPQY
jgi:hypothetical protein